MKQFFKMFFASLLAMGFAAVGLFLFMVIFFSVIISLNEPQPVIRKDSVLVFDMSVAIQDRPVGMTGREFIDEAMGMGGSHALSLLSLIRGIDAAAEDDDVKGLLLQGSFQVEGYGSGFAALKEVKEAIERFSDSGKPVWAYVLYPTARDLYVLSAAEKIYMNPEGVVSDTGMAMSYPFLGGFMEKYGIGVQVTRAGEYKAAAESFVLEKMSDPAREANEAVLEDFWSEYLDTIAAGAGIEPSEYEAKLNEVGMLMAPEALELGLVDELAYSHTLVEDMQAVSGKDEEGVSFIQTSLSDYIAARVYPEYSSDGYVSVIYAEGSIVGGEGEENQVGGSRFVREIRKARLDDDVKAIVLRVNSPGGSALASEVIQKELRLAQEEKPVVVSMGALAASGGYWISTYADKIFAQPNTLTGSIGVIGVFFNYEEIAGKHGINFDTVKTTKHADLMSSFREKSAEEMGLVQRQVDAVYDSFLTKVSEGRGLDIERVREIAGGRIWSGEDALELGLVDELGGLQDAIAYAASEAGLGEDAAVQERPEPVDFFKQLSESMAKRGASVSGGLLEPVGDIYNELLQLGSQYNDPKGVYAVLPYTINVD